jgi:hypothetical protein
MECLAGTEFQKYNSDSQGVSVSYRYLHSQFINRKSVELLNLRLYFHFCVPLNGIIWKWILIKLIVMEPILCWLRLSQ